MDLRAVLLDMGGVLVPETRGYASVIHDRPLIQQLREEKIDDPPAFLLQQAERIREAYRGLEAECSQPDPAEVFADLTGRVRKLVLEGLRRAAVRPPYPGTRELVADLAQRYCLGLVSNTVIPGDHHELNLREAGILRYFRAAVWSANFGTRKPDPAMIEHILERLGARPESAIFVGDKIRTDIAAARRAGITVIWLQHGKTKETEAIEPDFVIRDLHELPGLLQHLGTSERPLWEG